MKRERLTRTQAAAVAATGLLAIVAGISAGTVSESAKNRSECTRVWVLTGQGNSPYHHYGNKIKEWLEESDGGWKDEEVTVEVTRGVADNIRAMTNTETNTDRGSARFDIPAEGRATCTLSLVQLNTAYDAIFGGYQFEGDPLPSIRSIGPIWYDFVHLIIRAADAGEITSPADLCKHIGRVDFGVPGSGTWQIAKVVFRVAEKPQCGPQDNYQFSGRTFSDALFALSSNEPDSSKNLLDAVFWAAGSPTRDIIEKMKDSNLEIRLVPLKGYVEEVRHDWFGKYPGNKQHHIFEEGQIPAADYFPDEFSVPDTTTIATPNGVVAMDTTDSALVDFVARRLGTGGDEMEDALWPDGKTVGGRHFDAPSVVRNNGIFCYVPLHEGAKAYYREAGNEPAGCF